MYVCIYIYIYIYIKKIYIYIYTQYIDVLPHSPRLRPQRVADGHVGQEVPEQRETF